METLSADFPPGMEYQIVYNPTEFIEASINSVYQTIFEAMFLVIAVIVIFLQSWRTAIIPLLAIPRFRWSEPSRSRLPWATRSTS